MPKNTLTLVPSGGLGNRMYSVASACYLCRKASTKLRVLWFKDWALGADFKQIFQTLEFFSKAQQPSIDMQITDASTIDYLLNDRPRRRNLWLPRLPQMLTYQQRLDETRVQQLLHNDFDFAGWIKGKNSWMSNYMLLCPEAKSLIPELFLPVPEVMEAVEVYTSRFSAHTFGFHIRRTDHVVAIQASPTQLFIDKAKALIDEYADCTIFLATDSQEVKKEFRDLFGSRVITPDSGAVRGNVDGIRNALVEMYTLARTKKIYGSLRSTFSQVASIIGGIELQVLKSN